VLQEIFICKAVAGAAKLMLNLSSLYGPHVLMYFSFNLLSHLFLLRDECGLETMKPLRNKESYIDAKVNLDCKNV
jgi:hypothetical protein